MLKWLLAALPAVLILLLMISLRWSAARAGLAGWLAALLIAHFAFHAGAGLLLMAHLKAAFIIADVLLILAGAFLLFRVSEEGGAIRALADLLPQLTGDPVRQALLIGWVFAAFLQGVGGFGVPVAITAPILLRLGFSPGRAFLIPSIGHGWAVTFGSLALAFHALVSASGEPGAALVPASAFLLGLTGLLAGFQVAHAAGESRSVLRLAGEVFLIGAAMAGAHYGLAAAGLWSSASYGAGLAGLAAAALLFRRSPDSAGHRIPGREEVLPALVPYLFLVAIIAAVQYWQPLRQLLGTPVLRAAFPAAETGSGFSIPAEHSREIPLLRHTGTLLVYASILSYLYFRFSGRLRPGAEVRILGSTLRGVLPSSLGIGTAVAMAVVMGHAGMIDTLARGMAGAAGAVFPLASPWIGAFGAFITGSNTNSNVLFASLQKQTAQLLGVRVALVLAAQTAGGAVGSALAPGKIIVGASTIGMGGREGELLKPIALQLLLITAVVSVISIF